MFTGARDKLVDKRLFTTMLALYVIKSSCISKYHKTICVEA